MQMTGTSIQMSIAGSPLDCEALNAMLQAPSVSCAAVQNCRGTQRGLTTGNQAAHLTMVQGSVIVADCNGCISLIGPAQVTVLMALHDHWTPGRAHPGKITI